MKCLVIFLVVMVSCVVATETEKTEKFTPEFLAMLTSVLDRLKVSKSDLSKIGQAVDPDSDTGKASSTTTPKPTTPALPIVTGETYCEKQSQDTFQSYCKDARMHPGVYVDPWDPYCGYIVCDEEANATRHRCEAGSWTGFKATSQGRQSMCRKPLKLALGGHCTMATFSAKLCRNAEWVTDYNTVTET